jgi:hypothetical protein
LLIALAGAAGVVVAQIEGGDRGVAPIDSSSSYEIGGITVDVAANNADLARNAAWRQAMRKGWKMLWARMNGGNVEGAPALSDGALDSIVAGVVVEDEQISPTRYIARLGVLFDRGRAGQVLGVQGQGMRSPPMLVIPVQISASTPQSFETRTEWQKAWARLRTGGSPIDYVRPTGSGVDSLLLNLAQSRRPGRGWWRMILDQYAANDVVVPEVILQRRWPGGPVVGIFTARHGPDSEIISRFTLSADTIDGLPRMLDEGVRQIDEAYSAALRSGRLHSDPTLLPPPPEEMATNLNEMTLEDAVGEVVTGSGSTFSIQVETPDAAALGQAETELRGLPGINTSQMVSLALGGYSVMRVNFTGDIETLRAALAQRGWRVDVGTDTLRIRKEAAK